MAKLLCAFSTLAASVDYVEWKKGGGDIPVRGESIIIKGGAGVVGSEHLITPMGVPTMITEAQRKMLEAHPLFKLHKANGFVSIEEVDRPPSTDTVEKAVAEMEGRDNSAPLVAADFTVSGEAAPTTGKASK